MISPERTAAQLLELSEKLGEGFRRVTEKPRIDVDPTPRRLVASRDKTRLYEYPAATESSATPLLIVYALVNRPYMLDLEPERSVIAALTERGVRPFLLDWGYPDFADQFLGLGDYLFDYLDTAVDAVRDLCGTPRVNILGVCQGGVLSTCYTAARPHKVAGLATVVTPTDFSTRDNLLARWARQLDIEALVGTFGNVPGSLLNLTFLSMKPFLLGSKKYVDMIGNADDDAALQTFLRMEKWINDCPDQAGAAFAEFVELFFKRNSLMKGPFAIDGETIDLQAITQPVLNVIASRDHLVPPDSSRALRQVVGSADFTEHEIDAGHIGLFVGKSSSRATAGHVADWLLAHR